MRRVTLAVVRFALVVGFVAGLAGAPPVAKRSGVVVTGSHGTTSTALEVKHPDRIDPIGETDLVIRRVVHAWADGLAAVASVLGEQDPSWGSEAFDLGGGRVALWGAGSYVNRAVAVGVDRPMTVADFEVLERRSAAAGVEAAIDVTPVTRPEVVTMAVERGYVEVATASAFRHVFDVPVPAEVVVDVSVESAVDQVATWQAVSAAGWGHVTPAARRVSDAFAAATAVVDGDGFVLARDVADGRPLGCASVAIRDGVATLGAMATLPDERGRGVQAALVRHRVSLGRVAGCEVAVATTARGSASERNLLRLGFDHWFGVTTLSRPTDGR